jgi:predicted nucleotidyltransferase
VFTVAEREAVRERLLDLARQDERIVAAAVTGSRAAGTEDELSDIDLSFGVAAGPPLEEVIAQWTELIERELDVVHQWDLPYGPTIFRVILLASGLQVDVAFTPAAKFGAYGPNFRPVFGDHVDREPSAPPAADESVGYAWLYAVHAGRCIQRNNLWQAENMISAARDQVLSMACIRLGLPHAYGRGFDRVPDEVTAPLEQALVRSLEPDELRRALGAVTLAVLREVRELDAELAERLSGPLEEASSG